MEIILIIILIISITALVIACLAFSKTFKNNRERYNDKNTENYNENRLFTYGKKHGSDKITHHKYHEIYHKYLKPFYDKKGGLIEIGIAEENSLKMWMDAFPNMYIYGIDIGKEDKNDKYTIFKIDQSSENQLKSILDKIKHPIYFINDDGSHIPEHQLLTFNILFPLLEEGGVYIIEDIECSYWTRDGLYGYDTRYGYRHPKSIIEIFKNVIDLINSEFCRKYTDDKVQHLKYIKSITFAQNSIIILKGENKDWKRDYRFSDKL